MDFKKNNPAVIKAMFLKMDKITFVRNAQDLKRELLSVVLTEHAVNYRFALFRLYKWCRCTYRNKFVKP